MMVSILTSAFTDWLFPVLASALSYLNFGLDLNGHQFGLLDFLVISFLLGILVRNFVHSAH